MSSDKEDPPEAPDGSEKEHDSRPPKQRGGGPAWLAFLLALAALGASAWLVYEHEFQPAEPAEAEAVSALDARLAELDERVSELQAGLGAQAESADQQLAELEQSLDARLERHFERVADLERAVGRVEARWEELPERVDSLERDLAERVADGRELRERLDAAIRELDERGDLERQVDRDLRRRIVMLEAAGLLRSGQDLAELAGDRQAALRAFRRARTRLETLEDPRLEQVQRSLAREIEALGAAPGSDLHGELAVLERLGREAASLPLQVEPVAVRASEEDADGWRERVGATLRSLVRVQARDEVGRTEESFQAAREQLRLRLLTAELAVARRDADALALQTGAAVELLDEWFQGDAASVAAARAELERLGSLSLQAELPPLGTALEQLEARLSDS